MGHFSKQKVAFVFFCIGRAEIKRKLTSRKSPSEKKRKIGHAKNRCCFGRQNWSPHFGIPDWASNSWSRFVPRLVPVWAQFGPIWCQFGSNLVQAWSQLVPVWALFGTSLVGDCSQFGQSLNPNWYQFIITLIPDWFQTHPKFAWSPSPDLLQPIQPQWKCGSPSQYKIKVVDTPAQSYCTFGKHPTFPWAQKMKYSTFFLKKKVERPDTNSLVYPPSCQPDRPKHELTYSQVN